ncbi:MAG: hypothetical protein OWQ59_11885 [Alicyclobacillaceae bacterium]|uniref:hypothetical protein n=1 Tax=Alicyclobacillus sp. SP_1 TaxID=2942475 RepID=UPI0021575BFD|nr:hypothetical protein [Alicyclobacillus sp. SP_1]MCY0889140.1 hypothetical protein [Alicyclobacillaceae bacterium]MCY0896934.1 hypothetical protein [Alicyclobacillaceae bacterium]
MVNSNGGDHLSVAKALYQLEFYLQQLNLGVTIRDLYERAYRTKRGDRYDDRWLTVLDENLEVRESLSEPFTTQSVLEVLMRTGHEPLVRTLMREIRNQKIGFTHMYLIGRTSHH